MGKIKNVKNVFYIYGWEACRPEPPWPLKPGPENNISLSLATQVRYQLNNVFTILKTEKIIVHFPKNEGDMVIFSRASIASRGY